MLKERRTPPPPGCDAVRQSPSGATSELAVHTQTGAAREEGLGDRGASLTPSQVERCLAREKRSINICPVHLPWAL
jgi:hypothetical protein